MAVKGLFKVIESIRFDNQTKVVRVRSQAGKGSAQRVGPFLYGFRVTIPDCIQHSTQHSDIIDQLASSNYGTNPFVSGLPAGITKARGSWGTNPGSPAVNQAVSTLGTSVDCDGAPANITGYAKAGDYVQISGDAKVYQLTDDAATDSLGDFTLKLNSPLAKDSVDGTALLIGNDVEFRVILASIPQERLLKLDNINNIVRYGNINANEEIE